MTKTLFSKRYTPPSEYGVEENKLMSPDCRCYIQTISVASIDLLRKLICK